jgi:hypothetical protein
MSDDALKTLLMAEDAAPPARDFAFTLEVMNRVARRRLIEGVTTLVLGAVAVSALLYLIMPYMTPAIAQLAPPLLPAVGILAALGIVAFTWDQMRPALERYIRF